jgi:hypothetical protein
MTTRIRSICRDSVRFVRGAVRGRWKVWGILFLYSLIFPLIMGYMMEIYRGDKSPPGVSDWKRLFHEGLKYFAVRIIYSIPLLILILILMMVFVMPEVTHGFNLTFMKSSGTALSEGFASPLIGLRIVVIGTVAYYGISVPETIGIIRYARTDVFEDAFDLGALGKKIGGIGWAWYLVALLIPVLILGTLATITLLLNMSFSWFPFTGTLIAAAIGPFISVFTARFLTIVYDSAS